MKETRLTAFDRRAHDRGRQGGSSHRGRLDALQRTVDG